MDQDCGKLPIELTTPKPFTDFVEHILQGAEEKGNYTVKFGEFKDKKSLLFQVFQKDILTNFFYQAEFTLDDFQKISKGFKICESVGEILELMKEIFNSKKAKIKTEKGKETIIILLKIFLLGGNEQEIQLELSKKSFTINEINNELCNKVNILEKELKDIKNENLNNLEKINSLEKIINSQKNEIQELKQWKENYDNELKQIIKNKEQKQLENKIMNKIDSVIIKNENEIEFLEKRLKNDDPILMKKKNNL